jgi:hypothetical protein
MDRTELGAHAEAAVEKIRVAAVAIAVLFTFLLTGEGV